MAASNCADTLAVDETLRLTEFARACKAAARVVALYPPTHPTITAALARIRHAATRLRRSDTASQRNDGRGSAGTVLTVLPDSVQLEGRSAARSDGALEELATLLHSQSIGEVRLTADLSSEQWHVFLTLVARPPEDLRAQGGISESWKAAGVAGLELRQIDYAEVLRERQGRRDGEWPEVLANYLEGDLSDLDDEALAALLEIAGDAGRFQEFTDQLVTKASEQGKQEVVLRVLQALADFAATQHPEHLDRVLHQIAAVIPRLTPDIVLALVAPTAPEEAGAQGIDLGGEVCARLPESGVADFVAQTFSREGSATARLAQAFHALVPDEAKRAEVLEMAERGAANLTIGRQTDFRELWQRAADILTNYSDASYVSEQYGRELTAARIQAIEVERVSEDPPERIRAWRDTVDEGRVVFLNHRVLIDLLTLEARSEAWQQMLDSAIDAIEQLVLTENLAMAHELLAAVVSASDDEHVFSKTALAGLDRLRSGPLMRHVVMFIRQAPADEIPGVSAFCRALGPEVIAPLVEALSSEGGPAVKRLREVLLSFGAAARAYADALRSSPNPTARRTAIDLLRAFGGAEALPDLAALLDDTEPAVQRDALLAIVDIGTDEAYAVLHQALTSSPPTTRDAITRMLMATRDERAAPLFVYILEHSGHRGALESVYVSAVETLGKLANDAPSVEALARVLHRGEWWAPLRTQRLRHAAASALSASPAVEARQALEAATTLGAWGVQRAARAALARAANPTPARKTA
jgi:HEAT repeats